MAAQRKLPIGIQDFESLRRDGYLYADKTGSIYKLISTGRYYFLSRPRRFGKSLLISTLKALFEGKRDLFEGLAITGTDFEWTARPVLHLDLNTNEYNAKSVLEKKLYPGCTIRTASCRHCPKGSSAATGSRQAHLRIWYISFRSTTTIWNRCPA